MLAGFGVKDVVDDVMDQATKVNSSTVDDHVDF